MKYIKIIFLFSIFYLLFSTAFATTGIISYAPKNVDMVKVRTARLSRHNAERLQSREGKTLGLPAYTGSAKLDITAQKRAEHLAQINTATHKRKSTDIYYNYNSIKARFSGLNVYFPPEKSGIPNFTENLAYQYYKCTKTDCTQDLITALKKGFAFFMSEKGKSYRPHYNAIANKYFKIIGIGIGLSNGKFFIVTHYATQIVK